MLPRLDRPTHAANAGDGPRGVAIQGSSGSIGTQTLELARFFPERLSVRALAAGTNWSLLAEQARALEPQIVAIADEACYPALKEALAGSRSRVVAGPEGLEEVVRGEGIDIVVAAIVGFAGLRPVLSALRSGRDVALANKEALVVAGELVRELTERHGGRILPVDSEHSAIFQCLVGEDPGSVEAITLTASGGPFRQRALHSFETITRAEALRHPNWVMGTKITVDSATMMNKGLEVIEAHWLFDLEAEQIQVMVHPQSIIHSVVYFRDGSAKAQLGLPDMRVPIQYALTFPERWPAPHPRIDWSRLGNLEFIEPDPARYPSLRLAYLALEEGGAAPAVLNAANEEAVALFLREEIRFTDIARLVEAALADVPALQTHALEELEAADRAARRRVRELHASLMI
jgi:1-deoxy-D-xylulose-5-phosphate reductoisomerase